MKKEEIKTIEDDLKDLEKTKKNFLWVQEFSKKIIVAIFLVYVIYCIISIALLVYSAYSGEINGFETLTTEINETFRLIVGGYLIKAGLENVTKIGGNYYDNVNKIKIQRMREDQGMPPMMDEDDFNNDIEENTIDNLEPEELS